MRILFLVLIALPVWSQTFVCDLTDIATGEKLEGTPSEVEIIKGKTGHVFSGSGKARELRTTLNFERKALPQGLLIPEEFWKVMVTKIKTYGELYSTRSERGSEEFFVAGDVGFLGYRLDRSNPSIKIAIDKGAKLPDHYFICRPKM